MNRVPFLDGLRGVAVLLVVSLHAIELVQLHTQHDGLARLLTDTESIWDLGLTGIHLFFVLSGYLLFRPYVGALLRGDTWPSAKRFYRMRLLRIGPTYWLVLAVLVVAGLADHVVAGHARDVALHAVFLHNLDVGTENSISPPLWTMAIEAQFYLALPLLAAALRPAARRGVHAVLVVIGAVIGVAVVANFVAHRVLVAHSATAGHASALSGLSYLPVFMLGAVVAVISNSSERWPGGRARLLGLAGIAVVIAQSLTGIAGGGFNESNLYPFNLLTGIGYSALLLALIQGWQGRCQPFAARWLVALGLISYSVYLVHWTVLDHLVVPLSTRLDSPAVQVAAVGLLGAVAVAGAGSLLYWACESRFERFRHRRPAVTEASLPSNP